jgi:hypothetical protein
MGDPDPAVRSDLPQTGSVRIRDMAPVIRAVGSGVELMLLDRRQLGQSDRLGQ